MNSCLLLISMFISLSSASNTTSTIGIWSSVSGCTIKRNRGDSGNIQHQRINSISLVCNRTGSYILVRNITFGVHSLPVTSKREQCLFKKGDCIIRTTHIGTECNGLQQCDLDLDPQYLHTCSQYSDYVVLDYACLDGPSMSICDNNQLSSANHIYLTSPSYPQEYNNSLNCSCDIEINENKKKTGLTIGFLDFFLEERDESGLCTRDSLTLNNRSLCGNINDLTTPNDQDAFTPPMSQIFDTIESTRLLNSSTFLSSQYSSNIHLTFRTNDLITRKGFWLVIQPTKREQKTSLKVTCQRHNLNNTLKPLSIVTTTTISSTLFTVTTTRYTTLTTTTIHFSQQSEILIDEAISPSSSSTHIPNRTHRSILSFILIITAIFVASLLLLNLFLILLCWKQRCHSKKQSSSFFTPSYDRETPVINSLESKTTTSSRYIFDPSPITQRSQQPDNNTSSTSTTKTSSYEDPSELITLNPNNAPSASWNNDVQQFNLNLHHQCPQTVPLKKTVNTINNTTFLQQKIFRPILPSPPSSDSYNRMIHWPRLPIQCNFSLNPPEIHYPDSHIYETIQDNNGTLPPYHRLASTMRRQRLCHPQCTCVPATYHDASFNCRTCNENNNNNENTVSSDEFDQSNPETLV